MSYDHRFLYAYFSEPNTYPRFQGNDFSRYAHKRLTTVMGEMDMIIVGESHMIDMPDIQYQEVLVSQELPMPDVMLHLRKDVTMTLTVPVKGGLMRFSCVSTALDPDKLTQWQQSAALSYEFAPQAWTILRIQQQTISTLHSYPQWNRMVITKTVYEQS